MGRFSPDILALDNQWLLCSTENCWSKTFNLVTRKKMTTEGRDCLASWALPLVVWEMVLPLPHKMLKHLKYSKYPTIILQNIFPLPSYVKCCQKPHLEHLFWCCKMQCPNPGGFTSEQELHIHNGKSLHCPVHADLCHDTSISFLVTTMGHWWWRY